MNIKLTYVGLLWPPLVLLILTNLSALVFPLPVLLQMFLNASLSIHLGSLISAGLIKTAAYQEVQESEEELLSNQNEGYSCEYLW